MKPPRRNPTARPSALERLERRLDTARHGSNAEIIRLMRVAMFADVDELEASGTVKLPEPTPPPRQGRVADLPQSFVPACGTDGMPGRSGSSVPPFNP